MKYFIIAGEASGDLHASMLIEALRQSDPAAEFVFLGGDLMARAAGCEPVIHYRDMAYMGFTEVLKHLPAVLRNMKTAKAIAADASVDKVVLVDYPSFNLRIAAVAHKCGKPVYYYISPKLWAWKAWRIKDMKRWVHRTLCILPFEPAWYAERGYDRACYVGNPSVEEIDRALASAPGRTEFLESHRLRTNRRVIALLPGSRKSEIRSNLPIMDAVARQFPQYTVVVAGAPGIDDSFYTGLTSFKVVRDCTHSLLANSHAALVTSGTATLETALCGVPQVVLYRNNGSKLAYKIMEKILKVRYVSLPNLICDAPVIPEMLLHLCTPQSVADQLRALTPDNSDARQAQIDGYRRMRQILTTDKAATGAAKIITEN